MRVAILGKGKMGCLLYHTLSSNGFVVVGFVDEDNYEDLSLISDLLIDFSNASKFNLLMRFLTGRNHKVIIGTTGYSMEELDELRALGSTCTICYSSNYSVGIQVLNQVLEYMVPLLSDYDIELLETHHRYKLEAPSGTMQMILNTIKKYSSYKEVYGRCGVVGVRSNEEIGVHSIRGGDSSGSHTICFMGENEELVLSHRTYSRDVYIRGVLLAIQLMCEKESGFYEFSDLLLEENNNE